MESVKKIFGIGDKLFSLGLIVRILRNLHATRTCANLAKTKTHSVRKTKC